VGGKEKESHLAEPKPLKPTLSKSQFFTALTVVLVIGLVVFFVMRAMKPPPPTACESHAQREENLARKWWSAEKFAEAKRKGYWKNRCPERKEEKPWWAFGARKI